MKLARCLMVKVAMTDKHWFYLEHTAESGKIPEIAYGTTEDFPMAGSGGTVTGRAMSKTREELIADHVILEAPCVCCGGVVQTSFVEPTKSRLTESNTCFVCDFWQNRMKLLGTARNFVVDGMMYNQHDDVPAGEPGFRGFGGREFRIQRHGSEEIITTRNLWCNGTIPARFRDRIKDNAVFVPPVRKDT